MKIAVWDTYIEREDSLVMHFDILVPHELKDEKQIFDFGKTYLKSKPFKTGEITLKECTFCHVENASEEVIQDIEKQGFHIIEMQNCS